MQYGPAMLEMRVDGAEAIAEDIVAYDLRPAGGGALPAFAAGAHVDLQLPGGMVRSYSLVNPQDERHRYVIAVSRDAAGRGGSAWVHANLRAGSALAVAPPRNNFPLAEGAPRSVLIAGGIGITPLWCMIQRLEALGSDWQLHYGTRTRTRTAFRTSLEAFGARVRFYFDQEPGGMPLDVASAVAQAAPDAHLYCCGPRSMMEAFERAAAVRPPSQVHLEYFSAGPQPASGRGGFTVVLKRSDVSFEVPRGKTILDTMIARGMDAPYSCLEGVCGTCETRVLEGTPEHHDLVLSRDERASNRTMMICCSGSRTPKLVLDL